MDQSYVLKAIETEAAFERIFKTFGVQAQAMKFCEEMAELIVVLCKRFNGPVDAPKVVDEIADVYIMLSQFRLYYGKEIVDKRIREKLDRTMKYLEASEK